MRNAFAAEVTQLVADDSRVVLLAGDIGNRLFDKIKDQAPDRFFNCGVAEANMIGIAGGLALSGFRPIAYTITPFVTTRVLEQIRNDLCYHNVPAMVVGVGGGLSYASLGATHHACEDIALLRVLPNMAVLCPADAMEVRACLRAALKHDGPVYIRLGKKGEDVVHRMVPQIELGGSLVLREGADLCILSVGTMAPTALKVAERLEASGISAQIISFYSIKPLDVVRLADVFARFTLVATVEEHSLVGGAGSAVAEWLVDHPPLQARLCRFGTADAFMKEAGEQEYAREKSGLTPEHIAARLLEFLECR